MNIPLAAPHTSRSLPIPPPKDDEPPRLPEPRLSPPNEWLELELEPEERNPFEELPLELPPLLYERVLLPEGKVFERVPLPLF